MRIADALQEGWWVIQNLTVKRNCLSHGIGVTREELGVPVVHRNCRDVLEKERCTGENGFHIFVLYELLCLLFIQSLLCLLKQMQILVQEMQFVDWPLAWIQYTQLVASWLAWNRLSLPFFRLQSMKRCSWLCNSLSFNHMDVRRKFMYQTLFDDLLSFIFINVIQTFIDIRAMPIKFFKSELNSNEQRFVDRCLNNVHDIIINSSLNNAWWFNIKWCTVVHL